MGESVLRLLFRPTVNVEALRGYKSLLTSPTGNLGGVGTQVMVRGSPVHIAFGMKSFAEVMVPALASETNDHDKHLKHSSMPVTGHLVPSINPHRTGGVSTILPGTYVPPYLRSPLPMYPGRGILIIPVLLFRRTDVLNLLYFNSGRLHKPFELYYHSMITD